MIESGLLRNKDKRFLDCHAAKKPRLAKTSGKLVLFTVASAARGDCFAMLAKTSVKRLRDK